jgi:serine/threonine protein kinase
MFDSLASDPLLGARLGNYRIIRPLGMGGMGKVYIAQDETLKRLVALKVIHEQFREHEEYRARLMDEASAIANLKHPNIVQIYTAGDHEGLLFFAMELISGRNLKDLMNEALAEGDAVDFEAVILIGNGIANALDYAHTKGVIHRDVKPANVLITREGHIYLTDFGLALDVHDPLREAEVREGGTAQYMSPEQIDQIYDIGPASDQYSLGVLLYEMLAGTVPFDGKDADEIFQKHLNNPPPKPLSLNTKLTPAIQEILLRALAKHPADRFQSCMDLMNHLTEALESAQKTGKTKMALPAMPSGTRTRHGLSAPKASTLPRPDKTSRAVDRTLPRPDVRVSENTRPRPGAPPAPPKRKRRDDRFFWIGVGALGSIVFGLLLWVGVTFFLNMPSLSLLASPTPSSTTTPSPSFTPLSPTTTRTPTATHPQTSTRTATLEPPTETPSPTPTILTGDAFVLIYDDTSFNLLNVSSNPRNISLIEFERLDLAGNSLASFSGEQWARFNEIIRPGTCMRIEIIDTLFITTPEECNNIFDAVRTTQLRSNADFWTTRVGSNEFRVLWAGVEIKRCQIFNRRCEIILPR